MRSSARLFGFCLFLVAVMCIAGWYSYWPPSVEKGEKPVEVASGARARAIIEHVFGGAPAHPAGSEANHAVRERLMNRMRAMGLDPVEQRGFSCSPSGVCADVVNVLARVEGERDGALVLMAHYDSVPAGPGIADDASGTAAVLEATRAILTRGTPAQDLIVLITDGEELGLLGARLFVASHPWRSEVRWVINSEARGTTGPMLMFETSADNRALVQSITDSTRGMVTNSLLYTVYRMLPNDTDLTVLRAGGTQGVNFAMIGGGHRYHTPVDDLAHLDQRSLDHATRMVDAAATRILRDAPRPGGDDAVFFDVFGLFVVSWPAGWSFPLALLVAVIFVAAVIIALRRRGAATDARIGSRRTGAAVGIAALVLYGCHSMIRLAGGGESVWPAEPIWMFGTFASASAGVFVLAHLFTSRLDRFALWTAVWMPIVVAAPIVAWFLPGASFIPLVPATAAAIVAVIELRRSEGVGAITVLLPFAASLYVIVMLLWQLYLGLGRPLVPVMAGLVLLTMFGSLPAAPVMSRRAASIAGTIAVGALIACMALDVGRPEWSAHSPRPVSLQLVNIDGNARWVLPPSAPEAMLTATPFGGEPEIIYPFDTAPRQRVAAADPADVTLPAVQANPLRSAEGKLLVNVRITPGRRGAHHGLFLPAEHVEWIRIDGITLREDERPRSTRIWTIRNQTSVDGMDVTIALRDVEPLEFHVYERSYELPTSATPIVSSRPEWAAPLQEPDRTVGVVTVHVDPHEAPNYAAIDSNGGAEL